jgi:hypothetical protein
MDKNSKSRKRIPYWLALIIGTLVICVASNIATIMYQIATDNSWWKSLDSPPSGAVRIINADDYDIWVESRTGKIFTASIGYCKKNELCHQWKEVSNISEIPQEWQPLSRGESCADLQKGMFPLNPKGQIIECVYSDSDGLHTYDENYFALMANGSVKYWENILNHQMAQKAFLDLSTVFLPFLGGVIISLIYLFNYYCSAHQKTRSSNSAKSTG